MANYLSAIKTQFLLCGLDVACFTDARIKYYEKAVQRQALLEIKLNKIIDISILKQIVDQCDYTYVGEVFKALYLLSVYSFLCLSKLVPHDVKQFSPLKLLSRENVIFRPDKLVIIVKWSNTMQMNNQFKLIPIRTTSIPIVSSEYHLQPTLTKKGANGPPFQVKMLKPGFLLLTVGSKAK